MPQGTATSLSESGGPCLHTWAKTSAVFPASVHNARASSSLTTHDSHQPWCSKFPLGKAQKLLNSNTASFSDVIYNSRYGSSLILPQALHHKAHHVLFGPDFWRTIGLTPLLIHLCPKRATLFSVVDTCPFHSSTWSYLSLGSSIRASLLCWNIHTGHIPFYISTFHSFSNSIVK